MRLPVNREGAGKIDRDRIPNAGNRPAAVPIRGGGKLMKDLVPLRRCDCLKSWRHAGLSPASPSFL
jgi:hypothetical protein